MRTGQEQLEFRRELLFRVETVRKVDAADTAVSVDLDTKRLDVVGACKGKSQTGAWSETRQAAHSIQPLLPHTQTTTGVSILCAPYARRVKSDRLNWIWFQPSFRRMGMVPEIHLKKFDGKMIALIARSICEVNSKASQMNGLTRVVDW